MIIIHAVNGYHILPRLLRDILAFALESFPVVVLTGSRQTGKSTLLLGLGEQDSRSYLTLDDLDVLERARQEPDALVRSAARVALDEVQRSPDLLLAVKRAVDERRVPGQFILTGSANLLLMRRVSETLAGRAIHLALWPMARGEQLGLGAAGSWSSLFEVEDAGWPHLLGGGDPRGHPEEDWRALARRGGYPVPARIKQPAARSLWFEGYARTYLERDLQDLSSISSLVDFRRLMRACCLRLGSPVNQTELGRDVGLPQPTVHRYLDLLETSYQLVRVPAFSVNRTKRLVKAPKLYWCDTGLALHLAGEEDPRGAHLENLVLADLLTWRDSQVTRPEVLYWRTTTGEEVDFVLEWKGRLLPVEVKASAQPRFADARGLTAFRKEYPDQTRAGLLLHTGPEISWIADGVLAAPWWRVF